MAKQVTKELPAAINLAAGLRERSRKEEQAFDHPGHFQEYIFNHKIPKFMWEVYEIILDGYKNPRGDNNPALILAPRSHTKTTVGEATILWRIGKNPLELCQEICGVSKKASERLLKIASCIRENERYIGMFGSLYPNDADFKWNSEEVEVKRDRARVWAKGNAERDPSCAAYGIDSSIEGGRATLQVFDDIVTRANASSEVQRASVRAAYWMSFDPMLLPEGQQIIFGTRYHYADLYSELIPLFDSDKLYTDLYPEVPTDNEMENND